MIQKKYSLVCCLVLLTLPMAIYAQQMTIGSYTYKIKNPQTVTGSAFYHLSYLKDTTQPDNRYTEDFELDFSKSSSLFLSYTGKETKAAINEQILNQVKTATDPNHLELTIKGSSNVSGDIFYTDRQASPGVCNILDLAGNVYLIKDINPKIEWHIIDSTKEIKGNLCQKATGYSHGRNYTAWFCSDIPYSFGPRRLNGLPGLILEAYDEKREVVYTFDHIQTGLLNGESIGIPDMGIETTQKDYDKANEAFRKNPTAFMATTKRNNDGRTPVKSALSSIDTKNIKSINVIKEGPTNTKPLKENNPIDLDHH